MRVRVMVAAWRPLAVRPVECLTGLERAGGHGEAGSHPRATVVTIMEEAAGDPMRTDLRVGD